MGNNVILSLEFGPGLAGNLLEAYITNHQEHHHVLKWFKNSRGQPRYHCFDTDYHKDPHYISQGCGNGYKLSTESAEVCDDANNSNGDGCTSTCTRESMIKCDYTGVAEISKCVSSCKDGSYDPSYGEQ